MKKFVISAVAAALLSALPVVQATTVTSDFNVSVSLTAICTANNSGVTTLGFGEYIAFGAQKTGSVDLTFNCTRGLAAPTFSFDGAGAYGVLSGLNYSLSAVNQANATGTDASATSGGVGTADVRTVRVSGVMAGGQAGTCVGADAAACAPVASHTRTLTVTY
ncbi:MAG: hypothetical protein CVU24_07435 [Betaproteobacteria bacterium HGW-Betaproteobacteria-18]|nr:MAG: hypothetical protein CVU24_07435 [Betaproteobacteria bacterium HGW-Betaproteobacteria-18]